MPPGCGPGATTSDVRKWKRVETADGARFRSALDAHEAALLKNLVASMIGLLEERESASPHDELEQITGMKTGNSAPPDNVTLQRLLPDFSKPGDASAEATASRTPPCAVCMSPRSLTLNALRHN